MLRQLAAAFGICWKPLVVADIAIKLLAYVLLTPAVGALFHLFLAASGRTILADVDIGRFLLHPFGWVTLILAGASWVTIFALEQSVLMTIALGSQPGKIMPVIPALVFVLRQSRQVYTLAAWLVGRIALVVMPFLALGGAGFWMLLTSHDINFYLDQKPPQFWLAVALMGSLLAAMLATLLMLATRWCLALPVVLFENSPPSTAFSISALRTRSQRRSIAVLLATWGVLNAMVSLGLTTGVLGLGRLLVPHASDSIWMLTATLGFVLMLWTVANLISNSLATITLAVLLAAIFRQHATAGFRLPERAGLEWIYVPWLTRWRLLALLVIGVLGATLLGASAIHGVALEDDVQITAHRGGAMHAPENSLAAIRQAIEDRADWVEVDVQESRDGIVVVTHDSDLKRTSGFARKIWDATADELRAVDIGSYFDPRFSTERVPTLAEVLDLCRGRVKLNIELKYYGRQQRLEERVVKLVEEYGMQQDVLIMSLEQAGLRRVRELRPDWKIGLLVARSVGNPARTDADFLAVNSAIATTPLVRAVHARGKDLHVWTVNQAAAMSILIGRGIDNLITDDPRLAREVLEQRAMMSPVERVLVDLGLWILPPEVPPLQQ